MLLVDFLFAIATNEMEVLFEFVLFTFYIIGEPKRSKIRGVMKWWTRCISMAIAKTASRNVAFKVARMRDAIMKDQDEFITREVNFDDGALVANDRANLDDVVCNADLYIANQEDFTQGAISQS